MKEIWKLVNGSTKYYVSNYGKVKSVCYRMTTTEHELKPYTHKNGYQEVSMCEGGEIKRCGVSKLVAQAFLNNPHNFKNVIHIDKNISNNCVYNLAWSNEMDNH